MSKPRVKKVYRVTLTEITTVRVGPERTQTETVERVVFEATTPRVVRLSELAAIVDG